MTGFVRDEAVGRADAATGGVDSGAYMRALVKAAVIAIGGFALRRFLLPSVRRGPWQQAPLIRREPRWHVVTVNPARDELTPDSPLPEPLAGLGDAVDVRIRRA